MNKETAHSKVMAQIRKFAEKFAENNDAPLMEIKLKDGTKLLSTGNALEAGIDVLVLNEDGTQSPANDGEYVLEDEKVLVVSGGKVSEVKDAEVPKEEAPVEQAEDAPAEEAPKEDESDLTKRVESLEQKLDALMSMLEEMKVENSATKMSIEATKMSIEELSSKPLSNGVDTSAKVYVAHSSDGSLNVDEAMARINEISKKMQKHN